VSNFAACLEPEAGQQTKAGIARSHSKASLHSNASQNDFSADILMKINGNKAGDERTSSFNQQDSLVQSQHNTPTKGNNGDEFAASPPGGRQMQGAQMHQLPTVSAF